MNLEMKCNKCGSPTTFSISEELVSVERVDVSCNICGEVMVWLNSDPVQII